MYLKANEDIFGNLEHFTSNDFRHILDLLDGYMKDIPYTIHKIWQDNVKDEFGRVDIEVRYVDEKNNLIQQKLLILNDELIDGNMFHERYDEWYGKGEKK